MRNLLIALPALPLLSAIVTATLGPKILKDKSHWPTIGALLTTFVLSVVLLIDVRRQATSNPDATGFEAVHELWTWVTVGDAYQMGGQDFNFDIGVTLRVDPLTSIMLVMVTFVASLVAIYSVGYMHDDRGYWRFFSYVSLFVFSMIMLVTASNFLMLYVFWEAVGVCSYLLIGFWYQKPSAAAAGKKAMLVNRVGDFGFALGIFLIWTTYGTLNFHDIPGVNGVLGQARLADPSLYVGGGIGLAICLLLMLGACGKSAQFPLHVWLPDAMEGPTPVSALIHAATMVTAGVYMVARCTPLFHASPEAQAVVATIGAFTALMAGIIAFTQTDLKRVLAYSTVSQLGYMFLALGTGSLVGIVAGMFHLFTHAFFKALLFLGAGSVMHAMGGVIDIRRFSGLRRLMPITCITFLAGSLALAGVPPFAGFWSKDAILAAVHSAGHHHGPYYWLYEWLYLSGLFTALLTAMYTFRAFFLTFFGPERIPEEAGHHAHESPSTMTGPLMILAVGSLVVGLPFLIGPFFIDFLVLTPSLAYSPIAVEPESLHELHYDILLTSTLIAVVGVLSAAFLYLGHRNEVNWITALIRPIYKLSYGKFFVDQIYNIFIVWPLQSLASIAYWIDRNVIDGLVNLCGRLPAVLGASLRVTQNGLVQYYALLMVLGVLVLVGTLLL